MSKTYKPKPIKKALFKNIWTKFIQPFLIYTILPFSLIYLVSNSINYFGQRNMIKKSLLSSQAFVDILDENGFHIPTFKILWLFNFRPYILESIQLVADKSIIVSDMHQETVRRIILENIKHMLSMEYSKVVSENTSLKVLQPNNTVILVSLVPSWLSSFRVSLKEFLFCIAINLVIFGTYFLISNYTTLF